jgi:hypothetical protein
VKASIIKLVEVWKLWTIWFVASSNFVRYSCPLLLFRIRSLTSSIHLRNVMNSSLSDRLRKSSLSSSRRAQCPDIQLAIHPLQLGLAQISLLPCPFLHHCPDVHLSVVCVLLFSFYSAFLDEWFPMPSVMFSRMLYHPSSFTTWDAHSFFCFKSL